MSSKGMKVVICGPRDYFDFDKLCEAIKRSGFNIGEVVSGHAEGVDKLGEKWASENKIKCTVFEAKWNDIKAEGAVVKVNNWGKPYNANAGFARNAEMVKYADAVIAIIKNSPGTDNTVKTAKQAGKPVFEYNPDDNLTDEDYSYTF